MTRATISITANVIRYCTSETLNEKRGGTYRKSNAATLRNAASTAGPRPKRTATATTPSRNSMTMFERSSTSCSGAASAAMTPHTAAAIA